MGRERKFRVWDKKQSVFLGEFDFLITPDGELAENDCCLLSGREDMVTEDFIGLIAKNNTPVFEGDIIRHNDKNFVCIWSEKIGFVFIEINKNSGNVLVDKKVLISHNRRSQFEISNYIKYCEVIGNIHQTPELLKIK